MLEPNASSRQSVRLLNTSCPPYMCYSGLDRTQPLTKQIDIITHTILHLSLSSIDCLVDGHRAHVSVMPSKNVI